MGNAREIRRNNETALGPAPSEPPALPPRPLVETIPNNTRVIENQDAASNNNCNPCSKKYVMLCAACGGLAIILGSLFAVLYVVLRSYTSSLHYFETLPSYVASVSLIITGLLMLCFGWRRNRFGYLDWVVGREQLYWQKYVGQLHLEKELQFYLFVVVFDKSDS